MEYFLTVGQQVLILFVLILCGYALGKGKVIGDTGAKAMSDVTLLLASPCVIALSFEREFSWTVVRELGMALLLGVGIHLVAIGLAQALYRKDAPRDRVLRMATVLSNAGFMGLPLQQAVLGGDGVFYGAAYVTAFNLTLWTYGLMTMDRSSTRISARKILINPGVIGLVAGVVILVLPVQLPPLIRTPVAHLAALNTPVPMLFIGYSLSKVQLGKILRDKTYYIACAIRLLAVPAITVGMLYLVGVRDTLLLSMAISASAPVAAAVSMFAGKYEQDTETAVNLVALSTVFSVVTMPVFVSLVKLIA
ncbi:MAG: AEC family transporter [Clostridia bacterium]|nr:AEC family transporter [Clostridia bacterium]